MCNEMEYDDEGRKTASFMGCEGRYDSCSFWTYPEDGDAAKEYIKGDCTQRVREFLERQQ